MRKLKVLLLGVALLITPACHRKVVVANVPVGISATTVANWYAATGIYQQVGVTTKQLLSATIQLKSEFPDTETYDKTMQGFGTAAQVGVQAGIYLQSVPQTWDANVSTKVAAYADQIQSQINMAVNDGLSHVKDSSKKQAILTLVATVNTAVKTAIALNTPAGGK